MLVPQASRMVPQASRMVCQASRMVPQASRMVPQASRMVPQACRMVRQASRMVPPLNQRLCHHATERDKQISMLYRELGEYHVRDSQHYYFYSLLERIRQLETQGDPTENKDLPKTD